MFAVVVTTYDPTSVFVTEQAVAVYHDRVQANDHAARLRPDANVRVVCI